MRSTIIILFCMVLSSCGKEITIETKKSGLSIAATVNCLPTKFNKKQYKVEGIVFVKNNTNNELPYSNKDLYIVSSKTEARTYTDSIATFVIDSGAIAIKANGVFEEKVYWLVETKDEVDIENIHLELRN